METQQRFSLAKHEGPYERWPDTHRFYRLRIVPPGGLLRRHYRLRLTRDDRAWPDDPRAAASVHALENRLAAVRAGWSPTDALPLSELMDGSGGVPRS